MTAHSAAEHLINIVNLWTKQDNSLVLPTETCIGVNRDIFTVSKVKSLDFFRCEYKSLSSTYLTLEFSCYLLLSTVEVVPKKYFIFIITSNS